MAISTYQSYFMKGTGTGTLTWAKLFDFKTDPDLGAAPEQLETTTQSDPAHTYIPGLEANEQKNYTLNYDSDPVRHHQGPEGAGSWMWPSGSARIPPALPMVTTASSSARATWTSTSTAATRTPSAT